MAQKAFTRKDYESIRRFDRGQMENYIVTVQENAYKAGFRAGQEYPVRLEPIDLDELEKELVYIRGIGGAKSRLMLQVMKSYLEEHGVTFKEQS